MNIRPCITISILLLTFCFAKAQKVSRVYKIDGLLNRIKSPDTLYVVNFWATWCKPCIKELPAFDSLYNKTKNGKIKIILVSIDFKEELEKKVNPFLKKNHVNCECVLLDEINGNDFINKISTRWTGAIPGTLFKYGAKAEFLEKEVNLRGLEEVILKLKS